MLQRDHPPRLRHDSAKLALTAERLSEQSDVSGEHREDRGPISDEWIHQAAVGDADENDDVGNAIGQIIQDFAAPARLVRGDRDHAVEHVEPKPQITKQRRNDEQPTARVPISKSKSPRSTPPRSTNTKSCRDEFHDERKTASLHLQFGEKLRRSGVVKKAGNSTSLPFCKAATPSGNTNDDSVSAN